MWRCAHTSLPVCSQPNASKANEKKTVAIHHAACAFSAAVAKLVRVKRFRAGVWKKLKGNNDSLGLSVME